MKERKRAQGRPMREDEPAIYRINLHLTEGQRNALRAAFPEREISDVVLLALDHYIPAFTTRVQP